MFRKRRLKKDKEDKIKKLKEELYESKEALVYLNEQLSAVENDTSLVKVQKLIVSDIEALKIRIKYKENELCSLGEVLDD